ncbi:MAG: hypothetical protein ACYDCK_06400 [Thermoplasmatota archaeon]
MTSTEPEPSISPIPEPALAPGARPPRPLGVSVIGALYIVAAAFAGLAALFVVFEGAVVGATGRALTNGFFDFFAGSFFFAAAFVAIVGVCSLLLGLGLLRGANAARIVAIVVSVLAALGDVRGLRQGAAARSLLGIAVSAVIVWYLAKNDVKRYFVPGAA